MANGTQLTSDGKVVGGGNFRSGEPLTLQHWHELTEESAIDPAVIRERGYVSVDRPRSSDSDSIPTLRGLEGDRRAQLKRLGFPTWAIREDSYFPMLWLPKWSPRGVKLPGQIKPWRAVPDRNGRAMKYASARGASGLDVHPRWTRDPDPDGRKEDAVPAIQDPDVPLWITEGVKKADSLTSRGVCTVALDGVFNWRNQYATLGDWEDVRLRGRTVTVCFDADTVSKPMVMQAMIRLGRWLRSKSVAKVYYLVVPAAVNGVPVKGVDDYFAAGGTVTELERVAADKPPRPESAEDRFTDSHLAEMAVADCLSGRYVHVTNLGWHEYDGRIWRPCPDARVLEAVREWARDSYRYALQEEAERVKSGKASDPYEVDGWRKVQSAGRLASVLKLSAGNGEIIRDAADFDTWPDLLNTPAGVIDLPGDRLMPHDPALMLTKMTAVDYVPGARSVWLDKALEAAPVEAHEWLQVRLGQAITGYEPDDDRALLLTGGGSNAKTTLMDAVFAALGGKTAYGYAASVPNTLLLRERNRGAATPEKMTIRGVRLAYIEETPEGRYLDTQALKEVVGTPTITGRELYKGFVTFGASHSLVINTNHLPLVSETDHGTWRRLARLDFPYKFVRTPEDITDPEHERVGDPRVKTHMKTEDAQRAILAWLVDGARKWYANGQALQAFPDPGPVVRATRQWRTDTDLLLHFLDESVRVDPASWVASVDLYAAYEEWVKARGHHPKGSNVVIGEIMAHPEMPRTLSKRQVVVAKTPGRSRRSGTAWVGAAASEPARTVAVVGLRFATPSDG